MAALRSFQAGGTIGIVAPSGLLPDPSKLPRAVSQLESLGYHVKVATGTLDREGYCAGSVGTRLAALNSLVDDPEVGLIMAARGGFGLSHLLPEIDWGAIADAGKVFCGFSDFTAFHMGLYAQTGAISLAGPMAVSDFAGESISALHGPHFFDWLSTPQDLHHAPTWQNDLDEAPKTIEGTLWGGNLSLLTHLVGTPYCPKIEGGILFIEDIAEAPYRVERMLLQLELAGLLKNQQAILVGSFVAAEPPEHLPVRYTLDAVIAALRARFHGPVITGLPFGHIQDKITLPFGGQARLELNDRNVKLAYRASA